MLFIIGGKSNNTDIYETFRAMADALREHFSRHGATPLYVVDRPRRPEPRARHGRAAPRRSTASACPIDSSASTARISEVVNYAKKVDEWMKTGGRAADRRQARHEESSHDRLKLDRTHGECSCSRRVSRDFTYYLGINSLADVATRADRVCVLNILGGESQRGDAGRAMSSPAATSCSAPRPGRRGQVLATPIGDIPVYNNVREGLDDGHRFQLPASIYLPPSAARDGVAELDPGQSGARRRSSSSPRRSPCTTAREIARWARPMASTSSAPTASAWRMPGTGCASAARSAAIIRRRSLLKGSIAIFSNSGSFTTTIATSISRPKAGARRRSISSGKDIYIHLRRAAISPTPVKNDDRSKAAVLYREPGGYYEHGVDFGKPVVACVVGRWKSKLTRAVGHAGAMAGAPAIAPRTRNAGSWTSSASTAFSRRSGRCSPPRARSLPTSRTSRRR